MISSPYLSQSRRKSSKPENNVDSAVKMGKPRLRLARCTMGTMVIILFAIVPDVYLLYFNAIQTYVFSLVKNLDLSGFARFILPAAFISFISTVFSMIFTIAILSVSSLTMKKQKRLKLAPYMIFALFKIVLQYFRGNYGPFTAFLLKDILLYLCMSHTAKNQLVRKFFKPYKQVVSYDSK